MILLDTSVLVDAFCGPRRSASALRNAIERGERMLLTTLVLYEWFRGSRIEQELAAQEALFPAEAALSFGPREASLAAELYRTVSRPRSREIDFAIAACALMTDADLWTLNVSDFRGIPGLRVSRPY